MRRIISLVLVSIFSLFIFTNCGVPLGDRVDSENLKVYFEEGISKEDAITFSRFWQKNNFVGEKEQTIQLSLGANKVVEVKLIEEEDFHNQALDLSEQVALSELKRMLEREVFQREVQLIITDNTFRPIDKGW